MERSNNFKNYFQALNKFDEEMKKISLSCFICDGIIDFNAFSTAILKNIDNNAKIIPISNLTAFIIFDIEIQRFYKNIIKKMKIYNYDYYSIFVNDSFSHQIISYFQQYSNKIIYRNNKTKIDNNNILYFCFKFDEDIEKITDKLENKDKIIQISINNSHSDLFYFSFNDFSSLISVYIEIIKKDIWPIFVFTPKTSNFLHKEMIIDQNIQFTRKFSTNFQFFQEENHLFYIGFIESTIKQSQRIKNCQKLYNINDILDLQISFIYKENEKTIHKNDSKFSKTFHLPTIRTFLGFDSQFRCLHVYDYLIDISSKSNSILDVILVNINYNFNFEIKHNLFYLEIPNVYFNLRNQIKQHKTKMIDPSIVYSINCVDSFENFQNFSSLFCFKKEKDLLNAKKLFTNLKKSRKINRIRMIDPTDYFDFFGKENAEMLLRTNLSILIFQLKVKDDKSKEFQIKGAKQVFQDVLCLKDNRYYNIICMQTSEEREKLYCSLKNSKYSKVIKSYYPVANPKLKMNNFNNPSISSSKSTNSPVIEFSPISQLKNSKSSDQSTIEFAKNDNGKLTSSGENSIGHNIPPKTKAKIQEFEPKPGFTYFYIEEIEATRPSISTESENVCLYGIQNINILQRSYFLPGTKRICSFFGFSDKKQAEIAIENRNLRKTKSRGAYFFFDHSKHKPSEWSPIKLNDSSSSSNDLPPLQPNSSESSSEFRQKKFENTSNFSLKNSEDETSKIETNDKTEKFDGNKSKSGNESETSKIDVDGKESKIETNDETSKFDGKDSMVEGESETSKVDVDDENSMVENDLLDRDDDSDSMQSDVSVNSISDSFEVREAKPKPEAQMISDESQRKEHLSAMQDKSYDDESPKMNSSQNSSSAKSFSQLLNEESSKSSNTKQQQEPNSKEEPSFEESNESLKQQQDSAPNSGPKSFSQLLNEESNESVEKQQQDSAPNSGPKSFSQLLNEESNKPSNTKQQQEPTLLQEQFSESSNSASDPIKRDPSIKCFVPLPNLHYIYVEEQIVKESSQSSNAHIFGIENVDDLQRFFYLPKTNRVCTFMGFIYKEDADDAKENPNFSSTKTKGAIEYKVSVTVEKSTNSAGLKIFQPNPKQISSSTDKKPSQPSPLKNASPIIQTKNTSVIIQKKTTNKDDQNNNNRQNEKEEKTTGNQTEIKRPIKNNQININLSNKGQEIKEQKSSSSNSSSLLIVKNKTSPILSFSPKPLQKQQQPTTTTTINTKEPIQQQKPEISIQAPTKTSLNIPLKSSSSSNSSIKISNDFETKKPANIIQRRIINESNSTSNIENAPIFSPKQGLLYFYITETARNNLISEKNPHNSLYGIRSQDIQRYSKHPTKNDSVLYTFFGFENNEEREKGISKYESLTLSNKSRPIKYENENENIEKNKNERKIHINSYTPARIPKSCYFTELFHLSISKEMREKISEKIFENELKSNSQTGVINNNDQNYIETLYSTLIPETLDKINDIIKNVICDDFKFNSLEMKNDKNEFFYFDEIFLPKEKLNQFIMYLKTVPGVYNIQRNVFYKNKIATFFFYQKVGSEKVINSIKEFLMKNELLFDKRKNFLKKTIIINEDLILQNKEEDFKLIIDEISKKKIKISQILRDKLFVYNSNFDNKLFQRFSFISFENEKDKLEALNHLNQLVFGDKENVLVLDTNLHYAKIELSTFSHEKRNFLKGLFPSIPGLKKVHNNRMSIENPLGETYIGFKSTRSLNFGIELLCLKLRNPNFNFFNPIEKIEYIRLKKSDFDIICSKKLVKLDYINQNYLQLNCCEFELGILNSFVYIGFDDKKICQKVVKMLSNLNANKMKIDFRIVCDNDVDDGEFEEDEELFDADEICYFNRLF